MFPYLLLQHHLGTKQVRENIKIKYVDLSNYQTAKTELENEITRHQSSFGYTYENKKFQFGESIMMNHALNHLNAVIDQDDPEFMDDGVIKHQSDIVKSALLQEPKSDYSS